MFQESGRSPTPLTTVGGVFISVDNFLLTLDIDVLDYKYMNKYIIILIVVILAWLAFVFWSGGISVSTVKNAPQSEISTLEAIVGSSHSFENRNTVEVSKENFERLMEACLEVRCWR